MTMRELKERAGCLWVRISGAAGYTEGYRAKATYADYGITKERAAPMLHEVRVIIAELEHIEQELMKMHDETVVR